MPGIYQSGNYEDGSATTVPFFSTLSQILRIQRRADQLFLGDLQCNIRTIREVFRLHQKAYGRKGAKSISVDSFFWSSLAPCSHKRADWSRRRVGFQWPESDDRALFAIYPRQLESAYPIGKAGVVSIHRERGPISNRGGIDAAVWIFHRYVFNANRLGDIPMDLPRPPVDGSCLGLECIWREDGSQILKLRFPSIGN